MEGAVAGRAARAGATRMARSAVAAGWVATEALVAAAAAAAATRAAASAAVAREGSWGLAEGLAPGGQEAGR